MRSAAFASLFRLRSSCVVSPSPESGGTGRQCRASINSVGGEPMSEAKQGVLAWVDSHMGELSDWHQVLWNYAEPAFREYKSSAWYVNCLREAGFRVEAGSGEMPTAFMASFENGP